MANKGFSDAGTLGKKDVQRGTQDELEVLALILLQLPVQKQLVLERLRSARDRLGRQGTAKLSPEGGPKDSKKKGS